MKIKKPRGHYETSFDFPVLSGYQVNVVFAENFAASADYLGDRDNFNVLQREKFGDAAACHLHPEGRGQSYIILSPQARAGSIAHESWHVIFQLMQWAGITLEDEFVAYHLGHIVQKAVEFQYKVQRRTNANSGRVRSKTSTGRVGRSHGNGSKSQTKGSTGVHGASKVRSGKTRTR